MIKDIEEIIRSKSYFELSKEELEAVSEFAQNEEEYVNMQWFLNGTISAVAADKITPSADLKKKVMAHLTDGADKKGFWLNSVGVFMFPDGKQFYKKPGFQLGLAAAVVIGFLFFVNRDFQSANLAVNKTTDQQITPIATSAALIDSMEEQGNQRERLDNRADQVPSPIIIDGEESVNDYQLDESPFEASDRVSYSIEDDVSESEAVYLYSVDAPATEDVPQFVEDHKMVLAESKVDNFAKKEKHDPVEKAAKDVVPGTSEGIAAADYDKLTDKNLGAASASEIIVPKSIYIDKTKELNQFFSIEK
ncbi:MAG: hypothetical protein IT222_00960 [Crocinitomix sp.]|nr:hypothetical protein [Crocinitomix sp.]